MVGSDSLHRTKQHVKDKLSIIRQTTKNFSVDKINLNNGKIIDIKNNFIK